MGKRKIGNLWEVIDLKQKETFLCIDLKSFYASVECVERGLDPFTTNLVVADPDRSVSTICLAITPAMKKLGIRNRCRIHEIPDHIEYIVAKPRMQLYMEYSARIYGIYLNYMAKEDIHVYSVDECFMDVTRYLCPQQEKALEELGFELPDPTKKRSRFNNRKMCFDAECRKLFLDIGQKNGVELEYEPEYGGASYLEKQDYIIENQQKRIAKMQAALDDITLKVLDMENMVEQIADDAYEKACEVVADTVAEHTRAEDIAELRSYKKWLTSDERKTPKDKRDFVGKCLDNLEARFRKMAQAVAKKVLGALQSPQIKEQKKEEIKERARVSVRERLAEHQKQVEMEKQRKAELPKVKKQKTEELG